MAGLALVVTLWWSSFAWVQPRVEARLESETDPRNRGSLARDLSTLGR